MKRGLFWLAIAFGVFGTVSLLARPVDWRLSMHRAHQSVAADVSIHPSEARAQSAEQGIENLRSQSQAFVRIATEVRPSVVSITSERSVEVTGMPGFHFFGDQFFDRFFQQSPEKIPQTGTGSGVIVSKDGYILTNNHVVADAEKIKVTLEDQNGRTFDAELVGRDPKSDVAVIRIHPKGVELTPIQLGDSDKLQVGEWVLAVGNPFQLTSTVTAGIVSAVGRSNIGLADYEDFIQTDAAINPGNSGGALVNLDGELVGINTAIATRSGGYQGIGFAIPINMARKIMDDLMTKGKVTRGWLGVRIQNLTEDTAEAFGLDQTQGALVGQVDAGSPADKAGIKQGDLILGIDGKDVKDSEDLKLKVVDITPGTRVDLRVMRGKQEMTIPIRIGTLDESASKSGGQEENGGGSDLGSQPSDLGLTLDSLTQQARRDLDLPAGVEGVLVTSVDPSKPAATAGLERGDIIEKVNDEPVRGLRSFREALGSAPTDRPVLFLVRRQDSELFLAVRLPKK